MKKNDEGKSSAQTEPTVLPLENEAASTYWPSLGKNPTASQLKSFLINFSDKLLKVEKENLMPFWYRATGAMLRPRPYLPGHPWSGLQREDFPIIRARLDDIQKTLNDNLFFYYESGKRVDYKKDAIIIDPEIMVEFYFLKELWNVVLCIYNANETIDTLYFLDSLQVDAERSKLFRDCIDLQFINLFMNFASQRISLLNSELNRVCFRKRIEDEPDIKLILSQREDKLTEQINQIQATLAGLEAQGGKIEQEIRDKVEPKKEEKWVRAEDLSKKLNISARNIKRGLYVRKIKPGTSGLYPEEKALVAWNNEPKIKNIRKEYEKMKEEEKRAAKAKRTAASLKKKRGPAR